MDAVWGFVWITLGWLAWVVGWFVYRVLKPTAVYLWHEWRERA